MGGHHAGRRLTRHAGLPRNSRRNGLAYASRGARDSGHPKLVGAKIVNKFPFIILRVAVDNLDGLVSAMARHARDSSPAEDLSAGLARSGGAGLLCGIGGRVGRGAQRVRRLRRAGGRPDSKA